MLNSIFYVPPVTKVSRKEMTVTNSTSKWSLPTNTKQKKTKRMKVAMITNLKKKMKKDDIE